MLLGNDTEEDNEVSETLRDTWGKNFCVGVTVPTDSG